MSDAKTTVAKIAERAPLQAGGMIRAIVPQDFESAWRMAQVVVAAGMTPKSVSTVEQACVAILHGLEVGFTPMAALQSIAVINGAPTIWGDGMLALIQASGLLEDIEETQEVDEKGEWQSSTCTMKRKGRETPIVRMFTRPMAAKAGLLGKSGPWTQYPSRMGQMRARAWTGRDGFPDVLRGLHQTEEMQDMLDVTARGSATTAPAEPRRSDFKPVQGDDTPTNAEPEAETWELFDEVGELVGEFRDAGDWGNKLYNMASKLDGKARATLLKNNAETAKAIGAAGDVENAIAEGIAEIFNTPAADPVDEKSAPDYWHLGDGVLGEANIIATIKEMIDGDAVTEPKDVENILQQNQDRIRKMSPMKRQGIESHAEARHAALQKAAT